MHAKDLTTVPTSYFSELTQAFPSWREKSDIAKRNAQELIDEVEPAASSTSAFPSITSPHINTYLSLPKNGSAFPALFVTLNHGAPNAP